jgi:hypothetical protein
MAVKTVQEIILNLSFYYVNNNRGDAQKQNEYWERHAVRLHVLSSKIFRNVTRELKPLFDGTMHIYEKI